MPITQTVVFDATQHTPEAFAEADGIEVPGNRFHTADDFRSVAGAKRHLRTWEEGGDWYDGNLYVALIGTHSRGVTLYYAKVGEVQQ